MYYLYKKKLFRLNIDYLIGYSTFFSLNVSIKDIIFSMYGRKINRINYKGFIFIIILVILMIYPLLLIYR